MTVIGAEDTRLTGSLGIEVTAAGPHLDTVLL